MRQNNTVSPKYSLVWLQFSLKPTNGILNISGNPKEFGTHVVLVPKSIQSGLRFQNTKSKLEKKTLWIQLLAHQRKFSNKLEFH